MFSRTIFRYGARLASTGSRSLLASTRPRSLTASKSLALAASTPRMASSITFMKGDWHCEQCGYHNFANKGVCVCGNFRPRGKPAPVPIANRTLPAPIGPYSHVMKTPAAIYVSGQIPMDVDGNLVEGTISVQTEAVFRNLSAALSAASSSLEQVVKVQVFLTDMEDFAEMNRVYEKWLEHKPARSCVAVKELPKGVSVEIDCIAAT